MIATIKPLLTLTAADLMTPDVVLVPRAMSLRAAAHILSEAGVSGAPVVDEAGKCVGVLSTTDFMHWVGYEGRGDCTPADDDPSAFHSAWQVVDMGDLPLDEVGNQMTADPVIVSPSTSVAKLARAMIDAHIHRVIVVDALRRPIGIVSSTDVLAAVASADRWAR
jgi:CBS domain-containing protein